MHVVQFLEFYLFLLSKLFREDSIFLIIFLHDYLLHLKEKEVNMNLIKTIEKGLLGVIALLTIVATVQEIASIYMVGRVNLPDLLLYLYTQRF